MQQKSAFSTPTNAAEREAPRSQPLREVSANDTKRKAQMKLLNDLLHRLAANKQNQNGSCGSSNGIGKNSFLMKTKSIISPNKGKVTLLGKRSMAFNQHKENVAQQQIYQPIPKRTKVDSPLLQTVRSEHSEKSSVTRKNEQGSDNMRLLIK